MANFEVLSLDPTTPQIRAPGAGDGYSVPRDMTFATGTTLNAPTTVVSVNTSTDALRITQVGSGNAIKVEDSANPDASPFVVTSDGLVGVGVAAPVAPLSIGSSAGAGANEFLVYGAMDAFPSSGSDSAAFIARTGSTGSAPFDNAGSLIYRPRVSSTAGRSSHIFYTGSPSAERLRINESGNVGIGTASPVSMLQVGDANPGTVTLARNTTSNNLTIGSINFRNTNNSVDVASISSRTEVTADSARLMFFTASAGTSAERMRIDASGRVGINTTPGTGGGILSLAYNSATLYSTAGAWPGVADAAFSGTYTVNGSATTGAFISNTFVVRNGSSVYQAAGVSAVSVAGAGYSPNLNFWAQNGASTFTTVASVAAGRTIALEGATTQTGIGITFPATQVASANANSLDDYEEGTFTPVISGATSAGAGTYTSQNGRYTKVGRLVTVDITLAWTAHTGTGRMLVSGLPFTVANDQSTAAASVGYVDNLALTANNVLMIYTQSNSDYFNVYQTPTGGGAATDVPMDTAATLRISATYTV